MNDIPTVWIDILSEPAVRLAARAWRKGEAETWGYLSREIKAEYLSQYMPLTQFDEYIAIFTPKPVILPQPVIQHPLHEITQPRKPPPSMPVLPEPKFPILENIFNTVGSFIVILLLIGFYAFLLYLFSPDTYDVPEPLDIREANYEEYIYDFPTPEPDEPYYFNEDQTDSPAPCLIKGNISFNTGEHIYHLPGQEFYDSTTIDTSQGERWFCTEAEAQTAGWRKSRQ